MLVTVVLLPRYPENAPQLKTPTLFTIMAKKSGHNTPKMGKFFVQTIMLVTLQNFPTTAPPEQFKRVLVRRQCGVKRLA